LTRCARYSERFPRSTGQLAQKLVEPNSDLGKAYDYMLKRWDKFVAENPADWMPWTYQATLARLAN